MAERRIVEKSGQGIVCFISNYSWLDGLSFTGMREHYLDSFDSIWVDNLHGDRIISEYAPDGRTSETVFAVQGTSPGIKVGTTISLLVSKKQKTSPTRLLYRDMDQARAEERRAALLESLKNEHTETQYTELKPALALGLPFKPRLVGKSYLAWPLLPELFPISFPGVKTSRDDFLVDSDREALTRRMERYFDPKVSHEEMRRIAPGVMEDTARFKAEWVRDELRQRGFLKRNIVRYCYRPFDVRWLYWEPQTKLLDEKRTEYFLQVFAGNIWLSAGQRNRKEDFYQPQFTTVLADHHLVESNVGMFPLWLKPDPDPSSLFDRDMREHPKLNLTDAAREYLASLRLANNPEDLFYHILAVLHAPLYRAENAGALRQDWPRVPLPREGLLASVELGRQVAALLDTETPVLNVTAGKVRPELRTIAVPSTMLTPGEFDFHVTAGWGHAGQGGVTMPGKGKMLTRAYRPEEQPEKPHSDLLGKSTHDIYLNDTAYWRNVPEKVWDFTIGGYQVMKKWLSYREHDLLGRALTPDEAREVTHMARRLAALLLLAPALDANYAAAKASAIPLPQL
jgi:predicted helicase